jgi:glycosyltransferase involved in cell wall biosynthesis
MQKNQNILGIDAMNIRDGGGVTHLYEILNCAATETLYFDQVIVWGNETCIQQLPKKNWLKKVNPLPGRKSGLATTLWQIFALGKEARKSNCSMLFIAGGSSLTRFRPMATICHNMLPFTDNALKLYPFGLRKCKFYLLHWIQLYTFRKAKGIIFLSNWAQTIITAKLNSSCKRTAVIPHGINPQFQFPNRIHRKIEDCSESKPFILLYVSRIEPYKHQLEIINAFFQLKKLSGWNLQLQLAGLPSDNNYYHAVQKRLKELDSMGIYVKLLGAVPYMELVSYYKQADLGLFASSCENMPIILLEKMAAGLPILCSNIAPMPDFIEDAGLLADIKDEHDILSKLQSLIENSEYRFELSKIAQANALKYQWNITAIKTFQFLFSSQ